MKLPMLIVGVSAALWLGLILVVMIVWEIAS